MFSSSTSCDANGNEEVIVCLGYGFNIALLMAAIRNPELSDEIDEALEHDWWSEEELNAILIPVEEDEEPNELADLDVDLTKNDAPNPKKGQRINDRGWKSKRQWQKGRDNRRARHSVRAELNDVVRRFNA